MDLQDKQLIESILISGSREAGGVLVRKYYKEVYAFVFRQMSDKEQALDLTQDIFVSALKSLHSFRGTQASFRTWLYRVAANRVIDHFRSRTHRFRKIQVELKEEMTETADFTLAVETKEQVEEILGVVRGLDEGSQLIFRLKLFGDATFADIARALGLNESTVKSKYYAMLKYIRRNTGGYG